MAITGIYVIIFIKLVEMSQQMIEEQKEGEEAKISDRYGINNENSQIMPKSHALTNNSKLSSNRQAKAEVVH